ncbi:MAG: acetyl-CoA carboxylase, biotin carboxyl carrier protein [Opitutia bacterium]|nr:acetyl-CoA carboxylase biotin carboxyl carrier protein [Opitutales bacterium]PHX69029.1 MAG: acetyl-CoA carboxylase, biotin carboxyl carrier protein [Opitutae bacterium]
MDLTKIKQVVDLMKKSDLSEFEIQDQEFKLRIKRDVGGRAAPVASAPAAPVAYAPAPASAPGPATAPAPAAVVADPNIKTINSPMVGTYYSTPSPENPAFVVVGSQVKVDSTVCIIEAMKVMNEIPSEIAGTIVECLVANGTSVEFGQPLFRVKVG